VSDIDSLIRERLDAAAAFDVETDPQRVRENVARRQRRLRRRRGSMVVLGVLAAAGVAVGVVRIVDQDSGGDVAVRTPDTPSETSDDAEASTQSRWPRFRPAPGWETVQTGTSATAANVALGPYSLEGGFPGDTLERLKEGGVVLWAMFSPMGRFPAQDEEVPPRELPLSLDDAQHGGFFEGQPGHIWADRVLAQVNGWNIDVWIFYGGGNPTADPAEPAAEARAAAQEQLARLAVPARL
jgi:hypothetical protein